MTPQAFLPIERFMVALFVGDPTEQGDMDQETTFIGYSRVASSGKDWQVLPSENEDEVLIRNKADLAFGTNNGSERVRITHVGFVHDRKLLFYMPLWTNGTSQPFVDLEPRETFVLKAHTLDVREPISVSDSSSKSEEPHLIDTLDDTRLSREMYESGYFNVDRFLIDKVDAMVKAADEQGRDWQAIKIGLI